jgi:pimeloyl-ACP methyl ester carboxylesterase
MQIHPDAIDGVVQVSGQPVTFYDTGEAGDSPPIVLIHGTGGSTAAHYKTVFPMLAARHRVLGIDLAPARTLSDLVEQMEEVIEARTAGGAAVVVGYSLGAAVAALVAARQRVSVDKLVLIAGWAKTDDLQRTRYELWHRLYEGDVDALRIFSTLTAFGVPYLSARSAREIRALADARSFSDDVAQQMRINETVDITADLAHITAPTLVIGATHDQMVPLRHSHLLFGGIEDARFAEIPTGHAATTERPAQIFKLIDDFVRQLPHTQAAGAVLDTATF